MSNKEKIERSSEITINKHYVDDVVMQLRWLAENLEKENEKKPICITEVVLRGKFTETPTCDMKENRLKIVYSDLK